MKFAVLLGVLGICAMSSLAAAPQPTNAEKNTIAVVPTPAPAPTMAQDLDEIVRMVNFEQINQLVNRYLLNDAEFQSFVRIINSRDAYLIYMRFRTQPEVIGFVSWVQAQIKLSKKKKFKIEIFKDGMTIVNVSPFWVNTVFGWQGFISEFTLLYPADMISGHVNMKVAENGIFTQFWQRLNALKPVYERVIGSLEAQRVTAALQLNGIDVAQLDTLIRSQFGWQVPPANVTVAPSAAAWPMY
ncbi:uncharacterized protein LOC106082513 [Stomoxys calcitrans]|uniref:Uncharacterized protein n=1 Tax=Stomoxys calcitrans TaxID=35570 RepID=A0A1I8PHL4_STOCA|nr:uncharacterized protein LOC106082513 [Stomoxys calcitrans]